MPRLGSRVRIPSPAPAATHQGGGFDGYTIDPARDVTTITIALNHHAALSCHGRKIGMRSACDLRRKHSIQRHGRACATSTMLRRTSRRSKPTSLSIVRRRPLRLRHAPTHAGWLRFDLKAGRYASIRKILVAARESVMESVAGPPVMPAQRAGRCRDSSTIVTVDRGHSL